MSRREEYLEFLFLGKKDINKLPQPVAPEDFPLYEACVSGVGLPQRTEGFYRCVLNSDSSGLNFCSGILDLGDKRATSSVKVRTRFILRNVDGAQIPGLIGLRLFANNSIGRESIAGYNENNDSILDGKVANAIVLNKEYVLEYTFNATDKSNNKLQDCRYLKPFISFHKDANAGALDTAKTMKHTIDLYEMSVEVDGIVYDITDTVSDFVGLGGSKIVYMESVISKQGLGIRKAPWFGKTIACLGDSITWGYKSGSDGKTKEDNPWVSQLRDLCGFTNIRNYGVSGNKASDMIARVGSMDANADVITVMCGANDIAGSVLLGEFKADDTTLDTNTFYGAVQSLYKTLKTKYPNKLIIAMTPLNATNTNITNATNTTKLTMENYREVVRVCAKYYGFYVLELQDLVGFDAFKDTTHTYFAEIDKVHPNQAGHDEIAQKASKYINSLAYLFNAA